MPRLPICATNFTRLRLQPHVLLPSSTTLRPIPIFRTMSTSPPSQKEKDDKKDWSATQYSLFLSQRTRPVHDLISQLKPLIPSPTPQIYDLGCGPGNSTSALLSAFPSATATGMDSSPDMLAKARVACPSATFHQADLSTFSLPQPGKIDLVFSNAVFHWLRHSSRIPTLLRLFQSLSPGAVLAIQMPDNYAEPSHAAMRDVAQLPSQPFSSSFSNAKVGNLECQTRPDLDPMEPAPEFYNALIEHAAHVDIWRTTYSHILDDAKAIVEWVKGTGLQPFLNQIEGEEGKRAYLEKYEEVLQGHYPPLKDGKVLLRYPRLFVVAVKK